MHKKKAQIDAFYHEFLNKLKKIEPNCIVQATCVMIDIKDTSNVFYMKKTATIPSIIKYMEKEYKQLKDTSAIAQCSSMLTKLGYKREYIKNAGRRKPKASVIRSADAGNK